MSSWDSKNQVVVHCPAAPYEGRPGWFMLDCGCCAGTEWGGDEPIECGRCRGGGFICLHLPSKVLALYPGGPLCGVASPDDIASVERLGDGETET